MSSSLVLPRPGTRPAPVTDASTTGRLPRELAPPPVRPAVPPAAPAPVAEPEPEVAVVEAAAVEPVAARRLRMPPGRRASLWLAALVLGAAAAGVGGLTGNGVTDVTATAADLGLAGDDHGLAGGMEDSAARQGITQAEAQARLRDIAASRAAREPQFVRPVEARMTTCYCMRWGTMHTGVDLAAPLGTPIYAVTDGVVLRAGRASGFGYAIWIQDEWGNVQVYGHMRYIYVEAGQTVSAGEQISVVGNEGQSTGPHLHYEIRRGSMTGRPLNVQQWLADRGIVY